MIGRGTEQFDAAQTGTPWQVSPAGRMLAMKIILLLFFAVIALRLIQIQVIESGKYKEMARKQYEEDTSIPAMRGRMYDRNGTLLVSNMMWVSFAANPKRLRDHRDALADQFARVFDKPREEYLAKLSTTGKYFVYLERHVHPRLAARISGRDFDSLLEVIQEPQRLYNYSHIAGQLIGFTDIDNRGLSGIELEEDHSLKGIDGRVVLQRDARNHTRPSVELPRVEPVNGKDIILTIDIDYQAIAEQELRAGVEKNKARNGLVIMMDPATGELLAVANYPSFDPAGSSKTDQDLLRNRMITDMFEPGSVFKIVTASAALEHHLVRPEQRFNAENGTYIVTYADGKTRPITDTHPYAALTFQEAIEHSSNIVMAKISNLIGAEKLYTMARNYGFGTQTGITLPGEISGELKRPSEWSGATLNSMAIGYEVGVTPLQLVTAYATIANRGWLMKPYVVREMHDADGRVIEKQQPERVRQVVSRQTCETLERMFEGVVQHGTGVSAALRSVRVAGKTGTSRKFVDGKYETGSYTATFAGYFPADDPKVVCLVMLDCPGAGAYTGGLASAPIFKAIAEKVYALSGRFTRKEESVAAMQKMQSVPDVTSMKPDAARAILDEQGFTSKVNGQGQVVTAQFPVSGSRTARGTEITITVDRDAVLPGNGMTVVPDVRTLPIRRAVNRLAMRQLESAISGSGLVRSQTPPAGEHVRIGTRVSVRCEPRPVAGTVLY